MTTESRMNIVTEGNVLVLERVFDAPRELVFEAFSKEEHLTKWWGPRGWELTHCAIDFRPGGTWHYCMTCVDKAQGDFYGMQAWGKAVYGDIDQPAELTYHEDRKSVV